MHARIPKNFVLEERLERYADAIEVAPAAYRGRWAEACWPLGAAGAATEPSPTEGTGAHGRPCAPGRYREVHLDLGCGKGSFIIEMARRAPDALFLGMDSEPLCVAYAAQHVLEAGIPNALVIPGTASNLDGLFAPGELAGITINFPTPWPKKRNAGERIVNADHLASYRALLAPGGTVTLRTDSQPLFDYALPQFEAAGYRARWVSRDARADHPELPASEYEEKLSAQGATVNGICAEPGPEPTAEQLARALQLPQSLYDYLPENLFDGAYIPHGMSYGVTNLRNQRLRAGERG